MARILVLDDERDACQMIERVLRPEHEVISFTDEEDAMKHCQRHAVDLAILDIRLKKMSGVDVLARLRESRPDLKAIMLTGYPTVQTAQRSITLGAYDYLTKPLEIDQLEAKVRQVLAAPEGREGESGSQDLAEDLSPSD